MEGYERTLARACRVILGEVGLSRLWSERGPSPHAVKLLQDDGAHLTAERRALLLLAWTLWNGRGGLTVKELVDALPARTLAVCLALVLAVARGPTALEAWLRKPK